MKIPKVWVFTRWALPSALRMSAFGGKAEMTLWGNPLSRSLLGVKLYVRMPGRAKVRIRERVGSAKFMAEYHRAIAEGAPARPSPFEGKSGPFRNLCVRYYGSAAFSQLDRGTQAWRRHISTCLRANMPTNRWR